MRAVASPHSVKGDLELKFRVPGSEAQEGLVAALASGSHPERWLNVLLDTPDQRVARARGRLCIRGTPGCSAVLILKGVDLGRDGISERPTIWTFIPSSVLRDFESGRDSPLPWLLRNVELGPEKRRLVREMAALVGDAPIGIRGFFFNDRRRAPVVLELENGTLLEAQVELDHAGAVNQVEVELPDSSQARSAQGAMQALAMQRAGVRIEPDSTSKFDLSICAFADSLGAPTEPRSLANLAPPTVWLTRFGRPNEVPRRPWDDRLDPPRVQAQVKKLEAGQRSLAQATGVHSVARIRASLLSTLAKYDRVRGLPADDLPRHEPSATELQRIQEFARRFSDFRRNDGLSRLMEEGVTPLSDHTRSPILRWILHLGPFMPRSNFDAVEDLLAGVIRSVAASRFDRVINASARLTQGELDLLVIACFSTLIQPRSLIPSFDFFERALTSDMGVSESLTRDVYLAALAYRSHQLRGSAQLLEPWQGWLAQPDRKKDLSSRGVALISALYSASDRISRDWSSAIHDAARGQVPADQQRKLQEALYRDGQDLRSALGSLEILSRTLVLEGDLSKFGARSLDHWWLTAQIECGSDDSEIIAETLATYVNRCFFNQFPRGLETAEMFIERCRPALSSRGLEFVSFEPGTPLGRWRAAPRVENSRRKQRAPLRITAAAAT